MNAPNILHKLLLISFLGMCSAAMVADGEGISINAGLLYDRSPTTWEEGSRTEILGPLYYSQTNDSQHTWGLPPLGFSHSWDTTLDNEEYDFIYPVLTYDRYGKEYRWQLFELLNFAGGRSQDESGTHRFTLFPIYFQQRSTISNQNYTAVVPFYGHLDHRLFKDEIDFVMFPAYAKTRKKDVITYNYLYPFYHQRYGDQMHGWQFWPFYGTEHKDFITRTNDYGEPKEIAGYDKKFILFPFFFQSTNGIGTTNVERQEALLPFYSYVKSPALDRTSYGWPIGVTHTVDRANQIVEWDAPWPLVEFAHGAGKSERRVWPFFSEASNATLTAKWYAWPVYKYNRIYSPPLDRTRMRILFFLYSDTLTKNLGTAKEAHRKDFFPLYTWKKEFNGNERLQVMSILEPIFPNSRAMERDFGPLYAFWRTEKNPTTGVSTQSLLWNLYRHDKAPGSKKTSLLFGLFQYQSSMEGSRWRVAWIPLNGTKPSRQTPSPAK